MMKATVAMKYGDATADAILKRYSSINSKHPTYKALLELGKVEKTIFSIDMSILMGFLNSLLKRLPFWRQLR